MSTSIQTEGLALSVSCWGAFGVFGPWRILDLNLMDLGSAAGRQQRCFSCSREWGRGSTCPWLWLCSQLRECCVTVQLPIDRLESLIHNLMD